MNNDDDKCKCPRCPDCGKRIEKATPPPPVFIPTPSPYQYPTPTPIPYWYQPNPYDSIHWPLVIY